MFMNSDQLFYCPVSLHPSFYPPSAGLNTGRVNSGYFQLQYYRNQYNQCMVHVLTENHLLLDNYRSYFLLFNPKSLYFRNFLSSTIPNIPILYGLLALFNPKSLYIRDFQSSSFQNLVLPWTFDSLQPQVPGFQRL